MRLFISAAVVASLGVSSAMAADLPSPRMAPVQPVPVAPVFSFTGFYVGVNAGGLGARLELPGVVRARDNNNDKYTYSFTGGGQIGFNYQAGPAVMGVEGSFNLTNFKSGPKADKAITMPWMGAVRARLGLVAGERVMLYGIGGLAFGNVKAKFNQPAQQRQGERSVSHMGWTLGGGIEYAVTENLSIRGEVAYVSMKERKSSRGPVSAGGAPEQKSGPFQGFGVATIGLNYRL